MKSSLRLAWTEVVTADDYDEHMATIGQAQGGAVLTGEIIREAGLSANSRIVVVGAGTGQMFDFIDPARFRPFQLTCTDLNPTFLARLRERLVKHGLSALIVADDIENTALRGAPDLLIASLLLEHIEWRKGVEAIATLGPAACGIIIQENPSGMASAITPGRRVPASIAAAVQIAQPELVPHEGLLSAFEARGYRCAMTRPREVADGKRLVSTLFVAQDPLTTTSALRVGSTL
jgi:SAM-dependent methyltransferase